MIRSKWKGPYVAYELLEEFFVKKTKRVRTMSRSSTVLPQFVGFNFEIHNGRGYYNLSVTEEMVGHKFGEFALTRKKVVHKKKK